MHGVGTAVTSVDVKGVSGAGTAVVHAVKGVTKRGTVDTVTVVAAVTPGPAPAPDSEISTPPRTMDQFSRPGDGGELQQLGCTRGHTARDQAAIDRRQTLNDGVAELGRTRSQTARSQGGLQHRLLSLIAAREGIFHVLYNQAQPHEKPLLPTRPVSRLLTTRSYSAALTDEYSDL